MSVSLGVSIASLAAAVSRSDLTGSVFTPNFVQIGDVVVSATTSESLKLTIDVTEHPVEKGSNISDHARPKLIVLDIEGIFSNLVGTVDQKTRQDNFSGVDFSSLASPNASHVPPTGSPGFSKAARQYLRGLHRTPTLITIITPDDTYENMLATSIVLPRLKEMGDAQKFTASFKEFRAVSVKKTPTQIKLAAPVRRGRKEPSKNPNVAPTSTLGAVAGANSTNSINANTDAGAVVDSFRQGSGNQSLPQPNQSQ